MSQQKAENNETPYNWLGVLGFLQEQYKKTEWLLEKQLLQDRISKLEGEQKASQNINEDLVKRVKMLEFSLRQESKILQGQKLPLDIISQSIQENQNLNNQQSNIPKRKAKNHRQLLQKILDEVGLDDIFQNLDQDQRENISPNSEKQEEIEVQKQTNNQKTIIANDFEKSMNSTQVRINMNQNDNFLQNEDQSFSQISKQNEEIQPNTNQKQIQFKGSLKSHLDGVREISFVGEDILVSVSEDCMVKIWDAKLLQNQNNQTNIDPYFTLRGNYLQINFKEHTGPLFTVASYQQEKKQSQNNIVFTAGSEGIIKCWNFPLADEIDCYGPTENKNFCIGNWPAHDEAIWQITTHPFEKNLLSSSADGSIKLWNFTEEFEQNEFMKECRGTCKQTYTFSYINNQNIDIPTSISWVHTNLRLIVSGYVRQNALVVFDKQSGRPIQVMKYKSDKDNFAQVNKVISHPTSSILVTGNEDNSLRIFDINQSKYNFQQQKDKQVQVLNQAHSDAITGIIFHSNNFLFSTVGHDSLLKTWDQRKYQVVSEIKTHQAKYDESIHTVQIHPTNNLLATGGADGNINVFIPYS